MTVPQMIPETLDWLLSGAIAGYAVIALLATIIWSTRQARRPTALRAISVLKPLYGSEPELYDNLRSFCLQVGVEFQIVFGAREADDPALRVVERLRREFPRLDLACVVNPVIHGSNYKVSNLINMLPATRHPWLVLADSDIRVGPDYLAQVAAPLTDDDTGIVTCLYRGRPNGSVCSRLGTMFIEQWFAPSVLVSQLFGSSNFGFGATIALRRDALDAIGGFGAVVDHLADDYRLGELTRAQGLRTVLSHYAVETSVTETAIGPLLRHELRWLRTIRTVQPAGYALMFISFGLPLTLLLTLVPGSAPLAPDLLALTVAARSVLHLCVEQRAGNGIGGALVRWPLVPLRDTLTLALWAAGFFSRRVQWSGCSFSVGQDGSLRDRSGQRATR